MSHLQFGSGEEQILFPGQQPADLHPDITHDVSVQYFPPVSTRSSLTIMICQQNIVEDADLRTLKGLGFRVILVPDITHDVSVHELMRHVLRYPHVRM